VLNRVVYDSIEPNLAQRGAAPLPDGRLRPYYELAGADDDTLVFESRFESGNLRRAIQARLIPRRARIAAWGCFDPFLIPPKGVQSQREKESAARQRATLRAARAESAPPRAVRRSTRTSTT